MLKILFLGDDARSEKTAELLELKSSLKSTILKNNNQLNIKYDVYILPIPMTVDGEYLNNQSININLSKIIENIPYDALIISGGKTIRNSIDVAKRDDFSYKNAIPTAEGAIALAINNTDITLFDSKILITGFGKVAKILVQKLRGLCNDITVSLRNKSDRELIETLGIKTIPIESIADYVTDYNIIFNTVPDEIFNKEILSTADSKNLFIELASNQLGFDTQAITKFKVNYINAPGLPNKVAPKTAACTFAETITNILEEKNLL